MTDKKQVKVRMQNSGLKVILFSHENVEASLFSKSSSRDFHVLYENWANNRHEAVGYTRLPLVLCFYLRCKA